MRDTEKEGDIPDMSSEITDELSELTDYKANAGISYKSQKGATADLTIRFVGERNVLTGSLPDHALDTFLYRAAK